VELHLQLLLFRARGKSNTLTVAATAESTAMTAADLRLLSGNLGKDKSLDKMFLRYF
jgi:hypothetical protein